MSPPSIDSQRRIWSGIAGAASVGGLHWRAVAGAAAYEVVISDGTSVIYTAKTAGTELPKDAFRAQAGGYQMRVRSIDRYGFEGPPSAAYEFSVVGFVPSEDTYLDEGGVVRVGADEVATFSNIEGLEMTYGSAGAWIDAPSRLFFRRDQKTIVRFRYPGAEGIVAVPLAQQRVRASVLVGPKRAVWPKDDVGVEVRLMDDLDGRAVAKLNPRIIVMVGVEPIDVQFRRVGNVLRARVPRQSGSGPWVIRATVTLPSGAELGRDVLEIVAREAAGGPHVAVR